MTNDSAPRRGVVFDFDGVIANSEPLHHRALQVVLEPLSLSFSWEQYVAEYIGYDDRDALRMAFRKGGREVSPGELAHLIARKAAAFVGLVEQADGILVEGVADLIRSCRESGAAMAICSGALRGDIDAILEGTGLLDCFDVVVTAGDLEASKPDPSGYRLAVKRLGIPPASAVAIEDTPAGIESARGAGLWVVAVASTHPAETLTQAHRVVPSLRALSAKMLLGEIDGLAAAS